VNFVLLKGAVLEYHSMLNTPSNVLYVGGYIECVISCKWANPF